MEVQLLETDMARRIVDEILNEPGAYSVMNYVTAALNKERERRMQFYNDVTEDEKAEFINGEIVIHSPVTLGHNMATKLLAIALQVYVSKFDLGMIGIEKMMIRLERNDYEPDICFFNKEKASQFTNEQVLFPAPDLVVEILSKSTQHRDRGVKFKDYQQHGIEEYWIINPDDCVFEQYHLKGDEYELVQKSSDGSISSFVIPGFKIPVVAIFDEKENLAAIQQF